MTDAQKLMMMADALETGHVVQDAAGLWLREEGISASPDDLRRIAAKLQPTDEEIVILHEEVSEPDARLKPTDERIDELLNDVIFRPVYSRKELRTRVRNWLERAK